MRKKNKRNFDPITKSEKPILALCPVHADFEVVNEFKNPNYVYHKVENKYDYEDRMRNILMDFYMPGYRPVDTQSGK